MPQHVKSSLLEWRNHHTASQKQIITWQTPNQSVGGWVDGRFEREDHYEWLRSFADIAPMLQKHLRPNDTVLHVGCGQGPPGPPYKPTSAETQKPFPHHPKF